MLPATTRQHRNGHPLPSAPLPDASFVAEAPGAAPDLQTMLVQFAHSQSVNTARDAAALRPFRRNEFGTTAASPSAAHLNAANELIVYLRRQLLAWSQTVRQAAAASELYPGRRQTQKLLHRKDRAEAWIKLVEKIWDFYFEMFSQRQTRFGDWLLATDRIAQDCYQAVYTNLGHVRSIPTPGPFTYMETGFGPATFRRGVRLTRLGKNANPFPVVQLPYHRLTNPWTLGAVHHETSHNLQSDLGMWRTVPMAIGLRLRRAGLPRSVTAVWMRWHKEIWADLCGLLLGGPAILTSLIDVVSRMPKVVYRFNPQGVHPMPYMRTLLNAELLRRMGFPQEAEMARQLWLHLYPQPQGIPPLLLRTFPEAHRLVVDTICFQPYRELGGKRLVDVVSFRPDYQPMLIEAAGRLAAGTDPGIIPARFLVGAAREALNRNLARPGQITANFYQALTRR